MPVLFALHGCPFLEEAILEVAEWLQYLLPFFLYLLLFCLLFYDYLNLLLIFNIRRLFWFFLCLIILFLLLSDLVVSDLLLIWLFIFLLFATLLRETRYHHLQQLLVLLIIF